MMIVVLYGILQQQSVLVFDVVSIFLYVNQRAAAAAANGSRTQHSSSS